MAARLAWVFAAEVSPCAIWGGRHPLRISHDGVTVRQNNEPVGSQDVWHLHTHVIPRHIGDGKYLGVPVRADDRDRARYAGRLRELLG